MTRTFNVFGETSILEIRRSREHKMHDSVRSADYDEILEDDKDEYLDDLIAEYSFDLPELDFENQDGVKQTKRNREVLVVRIPFEGDEQQLRWNPSSSQVAYYDCYVEDGRLCFDIPRDTPNINDKIQDRIGAIQTNFRHLRNDMEKFNERFQNMDSLERAYDSRREEAEAHQGELDDLDFPIKDDE
ncbi:MULTISPECIES: hypothetical protein [Halorussus]|uniref:hypothetical protein n=1 Tax=Halorussus TaxID=1070314 RepID=UPI00209D4A20|nr:hypothetical protein [Halorussus vallis]USZ78621.1 hypothetical protein NGM07_25060 [Halorussus vallis]